ncbi:MAG: hypothetical protein U5M23_00840 [Marinagarivorans sp.]|nr:hypothetical protein [Marinagarivorans sp.]
MFVKDAHWFFIGYRYSRLGVKPKREVFTFSTPCGYGVKVNGKVFSFLVQEGQLFLAYGNEYFNVSKNCWRASIEAERNTVKKFSLFEHNDCVLSFTFNCPRKRGWTNDEHFIEEVPDFLNSEKNKNGYKVIFLPATNSRTGTHQK